MGRVIPTSEAVDIAIVLVCVFANPVKMIRCVMNCEGVRVLRGQPSIYESQIHSRNKRRTFKPIIDRKDDRIHFVQNPE